MEEVSFLEDFEIPAKNSMYHGKKYRGVYELDLTPSTKLEDQRKCLSDLGNLSLSKAEKNDDMMEVKLVERPTTPINETIRTAPKTFAGLCKLVRCRVYPRTHWDHISVDDQKSMAAVLLGEVNAIWPAFRKQVKDPFLTDMQNRELQRRITVHIVTVCEKLFLYYCGQVKVLNDRGIFSEAANLSRIRGQIAFDADKYLNLLSVRRHIVSDLKKAPQHDALMIPKRKDPVVPVPPKSPRRISFRSLLRSSRPKDPKSGEFNMAQEIKDLKFRMPSVDLNQVNALLPVKSMTSLADEVAEALSGKSDVLTDIDPTKRDYPSESICRRWDSEPSLARTDSQFETANADKEEMDVSPAQSRLQPTPQVPASAAKRKLLNIRLTASAPQHALAGPWAKMRAYRYTKGVDPKQDLENLLTRQLHDVLSDTADDEKDDIPPLIQAITRREEQEEKLKLMKREEAGLDERKRQYVEEQRKPIPAPAFPQPPVIEVKLPGHANPFSRTPVVVRTSDIQVPDKVDLPPVSLPMYTPLFNDLTGDVSPATVKELDANLFQDEELKEVYGEIMEMVSDSHLDFHNDPLILKPAAEVDLSKILASSSLARPKSQQIINPQLANVGAKPPWGEESQEVWERRNRPPRPPAPETTGSEAQAPAFRQPLKISPEKSSRSYASWLAWWKATITTDDYMKYLATQDTDFLGVLFHFYDSEAASTDVDFEARSDQLENERKKMETLMEIKAKKEHYIRGVWNANSVLLGGLGKYPDLDEYAELQKREEDGEELDQEDVDHPALPRSLTPSVLPRSTSEDSVGSESSFQRDAPRRKSATPRRRQRLLQVVAGGLSSSANSDESCNESEAAPRSKLLSSDQSPIRSSTAGENREENRKKKRVSIAIDPSRSKKQRESLGLCKDSGLSSAETEMESEAEVAGSDIESFRSGGPTSQPDEPSSGYYSPDDLIADHEATCEMRKKLQTQSKIQKSKVRRSFIKTIPFLQPSTQKSFTNGAILPDVIMRKTENISHKRLFSGMYKTQSDNSVECRRVINLLKGYYKSTTGGAATLDKSKTSRGASSQPGGGWSAPPSLQSRLEAVWKKLRMPANQKLDAALKYSSDQCLPVLAEIVDSWEEVTEVILKRETNLHKLEFFERDASDPSRFFVKGARGSSTSRLREAKVRSELYQILEGYEKTIDILLRNIYTQFSDIVTFAGRPYHEKMASDKTEMLYWLQQERRCQNLANRGFLEQQRQFIRENHVTFPKQPIKFAPVRTVTIE